MKKKRLGWGLLGSLILFIVFVSSIAHAQEDKVVFSEDFEKGESITELGWKVNATKEQSLWEIEKGVLKITHFNNPYKGGYITHEIPEIKSGELEFDFKFPRKGNYGMTLKVVIGGIMIAKTHHGDIERYIPEAYLPAGETEKWKKVATVDLDTWHHCKISFDVDRGEVIYYIDDIEHPIFHDVNRRDLKPADKIYLGNYGICPYAPTITYIDNIKITEKPISYPEEDLKDEVKIISSNEITYRCIPAPTFGDEKGNVLVDREESIKIGKKEAVWQAFTGNVEIIFDLGKKRYLDKIILKACASPANNISRVDVFVKEDNKWDLVGKIMNPYDVQGFQPYILSLSGIGRKTKEVKLIIERGIYDAPLYLSEVEFYETSSLISKSAVKKAQERKEEDKFYILENKNIKYHISTQNGRILGGWNLATGEKIVSESEDKYCLVSRKDSNIYPEWKDRIISAKKSSSFLTLKCRNQEMDGLLIKKEYRLDRNILKKKVIFLPEKEKEGYFLIYISSLNFDEKFWKDGLLYGRDGLSYPTWAKEVKFLELVPKRMNNKMLLLINFKKGYGFAEYRHKWNNKYVLPWEAKGAEKVYYSYYFPRGWKIGVIIEKWEKGKEFSAEVYYHLFKGDLLKFWKEYRNLPEVEELYNEVGPRAEWIHKVKAIQFADWGTGEIPEGIVPPARELLEVFDDGYLMLVDWPMGVYLEYGEDKTHTVFGGEITAEHIRKNVEAVQNLSRRMKVGIYTLVHTGSPNTRIFKEHPEWFITEDKYGQPISTLMGTTGLWPRVNLSSHSAVLWLVKMYEKMMKKYNLNFIYQDGGAIITDIDWKHETVSRGIDWYNFYSLWRKNLKSFGEDRSLFFNERYTPFADCGFIELPYGVINKWREASTILYGVKVLQKFDPYRWNSILYWSEQHEPYYCNYLIGLGMKPAHAFKPWAVPYISAAYETKDLQLIDADLEPDWRKNPNILIEAYTLEQGKAKIISIINHDQSNKEVNVSINPLKMGFKEGENIFVWLIKMKDSRKSRWITTEKRQKQIYRNTGWGVGLIGGNHLISVRKVNGERMKFKVEAEDEVLHMLMLTNTPGFIYSVNGKRTNFWFPDMLGVSVDGSIDYENKISNFVINSEEKTAEIALYLPDEWAVKEIKVNGERSAYKSILIDGRRFLLIKVKKGKSKVEVRGKRNIEEKIELKKLLLEENVCPGGKLKIRLRTKGMQDNYHKFFVSFKTKKEGIVEYAGEVMAKGGETVSLPPIPIPKIIWGGDYILEVGVNSSLLTKEISITKGSSEKYPWQPGRKGDLPPVKELKEVNRIIKRIHVIRTGIERCTRDKWRGTGGARIGPYAEIDLDNLIFDVGYYKNSQTRFGYTFAGIESDNLKKVTLVIENKFADRVLTPEFSTHAITPPNFAGIIVDYHTDKGYSYRVALSLGICSKSEQIIYPTWGKNNSPDEVIELKDVVNGPKENSLTIDISQYAPKEWDGKVWFSVGLMRILPGGGFKIRIAPSGKKELALKGERLSRLIFCNRKEGKINIDGKLDELAWRAAEEVKGFRILKRGIKASQPTKVKVIYDDNALYIGYLCQEKRKKKLFHKEKGNGPWADDSVEMFIDTNLDKKTALQFVVSFTGEKYCGTGAGIFPKSIKWEAATSVELDKGYWSVEIKIPFSSLGAKAKRGDKWGINFCRNRYSVNGTQVEYSLWSGFYGSSFFNPQGFGIIEFK